MAAAVVIGALAGYFTTIQRAMIVVLVAFLAGGVILNVLKEELPEERESSFWAFSIGTISYTMLLMAF